MTRATTASAVNFECALNATSTFLRTPTMICFGSATTTVPTGRAGVEMISAPEMDSAPADLRSGWRTG